MYKTFSLNKLTLHNTNEITKNRSNLKNLSYSGNILVN